MSFLQAGGTFEEVAAGLTSSQEYFVLEGGTNQGFIMGLYQEVLNRTPSSAEIAGWETALDNGESRFDVSLTFLKNCRNARDDAGQPSKQLRWGTVV